MTLQCLVLDYRAGELAVRRIYRSQDGSDPRTKTRGWQVPQVARTGLQDSLEALGGGAEYLRTSGFTKREDVLTTASPDAAKPEKRA